ncbi:hypothetical protein RA086_02320 [Lactiplantibacillus sp. WILCCON 0030]|uniref:Uncharacterized protein n=1 Tax=Lactiplantibacillus brownii TaxID=3069269 RepID=A0ABU1A725_9LACO|nr:hypothetical protein [Lactiplantibacillus brownii]MDQ7936480.1 hypothetical protein [Lactiplantibacillus brownii]
MTGKSIKELMNRATEDQKLKLAAGIFEGYDTGEFNPNIQIMVDRLLGKHAEPNRENYPFFSNIFEYMEIGQGLSINTNIYMSKAEHDKIKQMNSLTEIRIYMRDHYHIRVAVELREFNMVVVSELDDTVF